MNPVHCWRMSRIAAPAGTPSLRWKKTPVPGKRWSGESVAKITICTSRGVIPASSSARFAASTPRSDEPMPLPGSTQCRSRMPVRSRIQSSEVSIHWRRSSLVTTRAGT